MRRSGSCLGTGAFLLGFLLAILLVGVLALTSIYEASCGDPDTARPRYFVVWPTKEVPEDCRGAQNGLTLLRRELTGGSDR